ncbi:MAG: hypothetical protein V1798_05725 [Pseudomonadota bacterium]
MRRLMLILIALGILGTGAVGCSGDPDEKAIRAIIEAMRTSAEMKRFPETLIPIAPEYRDNYNQRRDQLLDRLNRTFVEYDRLVIKAHVEKLDHTAAIAVALMKLKITGLAGNQREFVFGNPLAGKKVELDFEKRQGRWWVTGSEIER